MTSTAGVYRAELPGIIYFVQCGDRPLIKIGWAADPEARLRALQCGCPDELRIIATTPGTMADERAWQARFRMLLARAEWYHLTDKLVGAIARRAELTCEMRREREPVSPSSLPIGERYRAAIVAKRKRFGSANRGALLNEEKVRSILGDARSVRAIAAEFGVSKTCIQDIRMGRTWRHVSRPDEERDDPRDILRALSRELRGHA